MRFVAFDVETPNSYNDRISGIGVAIVEDGEIVEEFATLVDPETYFSNFNIQLTGITPEAVEGAPTFGELWPTLERLFSDGVLVAHNAPFDMSVLAKCLRAYGVEWQDTASYLCTCQMGRRCYPELPNHRLNTLCGHLGIALAHHQADSDSRACAKLLIDYLGQGMEVEPFLRTYDLVNICTLPEGYATGGRKGR